jgi:hypothetical protein
MVAAFAPCDPRIAKRALEQGVASIRNEALRDAVARAIAATEPKHEPRPAA